MQKKSERQTNYDIAVIGGGLMELVLPMMLPVGGYRYFYVKKMIWRVILHRQVVN